MAELKRCPFCGFEARMLKANGKKPLYAVYCTNWNKCNIHTYGYATEQQAVEIWNSRTQDSDGLKCVADVVEVVRCADCKHCRRDLNGMPICNGNKRATPFYPDPDFYCKYGERRDDNG